MDFIDKIRNLANRIPNQLAYCQTEEATKTALVMPFINALGNDGFIPSTESLKGARLQAARGITNLYNRMTAYATTSPEAHAFVHNDVGALYNTLNGLVHRNKINVLSENLEEQVVTFFNTIGAGHSGQHASRSSNHYRHVNHYVRPPQGPNGFTKFTLAAMAVLLTACAGGVATAVPSSTTTGSEPEPTQQSPTSQSTQTYLPTVAPTQTASSAVTPTAVPPTATLEPTATIPGPTPTPKPSFSNFMFPYDMQQVIQVWQQTGVANFFTYHITHRPDRDDPCGYHPGDTMIPLGIPNQSISGVNIDVRMPYAGSPINKWLAGGGGDGLTFFIGYWNGHNTYLHAFHTNETPITENQILTMDQILQQEGIFSLQQGDIFGALTQTFNYGGWNEAKVHFTITLDNGDYNLGNPVDLAKYALPPTFDAMYKNNTQLLMIYEGAKYCRMGQTEKIVAINATLADAGFCFSGENQETVTYCGNNPRFGNQGIIFHQQVYDGRSVLLVPVK